MRFRRNEGKFYKRLLTAFFLMIAIPCAVSLALYSRAVDVVQGEVDASNSYRTEFVSSLLDGEIATSQTAVKTLAQFAASGGLNVSANLVAGEQVNAAEKRVASAKTVSQVNAIIPKTIVDEMLLYYFDSRQFITNATVYSDNMYDITCNITFGMGSGEWESFARRIVSQRAIIDDRGEGSILLFYPIFDATVNRFVGVCAGRISAESVRVLLGEYFGENEAFYIASADKILELLGGDFSLRESIFSENSRNDNDVRYIVAYAGSTRSDLRYAAATPFTDYSRTLRFIWSIIAFYIAIMFAIGGAAAVLLTRYFASPVEKMLGVVIKKRKTGDRWQGELTLLEESFHEMVEELKSQGSTIREQRNDLSERCIYTLCYSDDKDEIDRVYDRLARCDIEFTGEQFFVITVLPLNLKELDIDSNSDMFVSIVLRSVISEMLDDYARCHMSSDSGLYMFVCTPSGVSAFPEDIIKKLKLSLEFIRTNFQLRLRIGIGPLLDRYGVHSSYTAAKRLILSDIANDGVFDNFTVPERASAVGESDKAAQIMRYIDENYTSNGFCLDTLSVELKMSPSYVSRVFKGEYGTTVLDYMHKKRVEKVKRLLVDTTWTIVHIAEIVGYTNTWTLTRVFRKYEKLSPGEYREKIRIAGKNEEKEHE